MGNFARRRLAAATEALLIAVIVAMVAGLTGVSFLAATSLGWLGSPDVVEGVLGIGHGDDFVHQRVIGHSYLLRADGHDIQLNFEKAPPDSLAGARVRLHGVARGTHFTVAAGGVQQLSGSASASSAAAGAKRIAVVLFNFSNDPSEPYTPAYANGVAFTNSDSVAAYYADASWGQLTLSGDVFGWYTISDTNTTCSYSTWADSATKAASASGANLSGYDNIVYAFSGAASCAWGGLAYMPGTTSWLNGLNAMHLRAMAHELGHNFGTHHSNSLQCTENGVPVALSANAANCSTTEYGDPFSVMGGAAHYEHTNFAHGNFGWLQPANTQTVTASGTYTLKAIEGYDPTGVQSLRIKRTTGSYLVLEFRQPYGPSFDTFSSADPVVNGVSLRITPDYGTLTQSRLIDTTPATISIWDSALGVGRTFLDPLTGVSITDVSVSSTGATVLVSFGAGGTSPSPTPAPTTTPSDTPAPTQSPSPTPTPTASPTPTPPPDTEPPTAPTNLVATLGKGKKVLLSWGPSSDNVGVAGYRMYRNGALAGSTSTTTVTDTLPGKVRTAVYYVVAYDAAGNVSAVSGLVTVAAGG